MLAASFAATNLPLRSPSSGSGIGNVLTQNHSIFTSKLSFQRELRYIKTSIRVTNERPDQINYSRFNQQGETHLPHGLSSGKSALNVALTDVLELEPAVEVNEAENKNNVLEDEEAIKEHHLHLTLDTGFEAPEINAFGHSFRDYNKESARQNTVEQFYKTQHINQTYEFAVKKKEDYAQLNKAEMSIWECCELLNEFIDESDPDLDEPQIEQLLQSAEAIRRDYPKEDWLHLTALIHDLGKVLLHPSFGAQPQWCVVGDTFPLGCEFHESVVHHKYFQENPDFHNPIFNTKLGIYSQNCGLDKVTMSWGHDEYMYLVAKGNKTTLPPASLFIIRFHSFYALHRSNAYTYFMNDEDKEMLKWLKVFNKYDLYSKSKVRINQEEVKPYYLSLIRKYFPAKLRW